MEFTKKDREILRNLGKRLAEIASDPVQQSKKKLWYDLNSLKSTRPVIFCDPERGWGEIITDDILECESNYARGFEYELKREIFRGEKMKDDKVVEAVLRVPYIHTDSGWGMSETRVGGGDRG